jgi:hypothetical protein
VIAHDPIGHAAFVVKRKGQEKRRRESFLTAD